MQERDEFEEKAERDIEKLKEKKESEIKKIEEEMQQKKYGQQVAQTESQMAEHKKKDKEQRFKDINDEIKSIDDEILTFTKDKENNDKEVRERDTTIENKIERINELKRKTQELEKFKFVLDYKIKELKRDIGPREEDIAKMKEQLNNMASEVEHFLRTNAHLKLFVSDFNLKLQGMKKEIVKQDETITKNDSYIKAFENDLAEVYSHINDYKKLKQSLVNLYNKYVQNDGKKLEVTVDKQKWFIESRAYFETLIATLKDKFKKNMAVHKQDNLKIMHENKELIWNINELKRENKFNRDKEHLLKNELDKVNEAEAQLLDYQNGKPDDQDDASYGNDEDLEEEDEEEDL